jgi:LysR family glycine cleavage system transcriptional activator
MIEGQKLGGGHSPLGGLWPMVHHKSLSLSLILRLVQYPGLDIHLCAPASPVEFPRDAITVSIRTGRSAWPEDIVQEAFLDEEFEAAGSPDLVQHCPLVPPEDLHYHTLLHTDTRKHAWHDWLRLTGVAGVDLTAGQRFETFYFLPQAAVSGFGMAIGPHALVADDVAAGRLVAPFGFVPNGLSRYVSYPKACATDPQVVALRDWLLEVGRASPNADGLV